MTDIQKQIEVVREALKSVSPWCNVSHGHETCDFPLVQEGILAISTIEFYIKKVDSELSDCKRFMDSAVYHMENKTDIVGSPWFVGLKNMVKKVEEREAKR